MEQERRTGIMELATSGENTTISFQHGFISQVIDRGRRGRDWTPAGLLTTIFGWREGKYRFTPRDEVEVDPGFPLRPGKLLMLAWLLCMERNKRFLRKRALFDGFVSADSRRGADVYLHQILTARFEKKSGELEVEGKETKMKLAFLDGEVVGVDREIPSELIDELAIRYALISPERVEELRAEAIESRKKLVTVALQRKYLTGLSLELLQALADWELIAESFHWEGIHSYWADGSQPEAKGEEAEVSDVANLPSIEVEGLPGAPSADGVRRCGTCGNEIPDGVSFCEHCVLPRARPGAKSRKRSKSKSFSINAQGIQFIVILLFAVVALWWGLQSPKKPKAVASNARRPTPVAATKRSPGKEITLVTMKGDVKKVISTQIKRFLYDAESDAITLLTTKGDMQVPFSEVKKFPEKIQKSLKDLRERKRKN